MHSMKHSSLDLSSLVLHTTVKSKKYFRKFSNIFSNSEMQILLRMNEDKTKKLVNIFFQLF